MFGKIPEEAGLYFFKSSMLVTKTFKEKTIREYEEKIHEVASHIMNEEFEITAAFTCRYCAFSTSARTARRMFCFKYNFL